MTIYETARFRVRHAELETCLALIRELVAYVQANEPDTLR